MFKANYIYKKNLEGLLNSPYNTLDGKVRPHYKSDGKPAHAQYITDITDVYDISKGEFPITNYRPINWKAAIGELLWIWVDQSNDISLLERKYGVKWWRPWNIGDGTIGMRYGDTLKRHNIVNNLIVGLKKDPMSRRHICTMWQYDDFLKTKGLTPCVYETVWNVRGEYLDVFILQRSSDYILSECFNRLQYCALLMMFAQCSGLKPGRITYHVNNMHLYDRHVKNAKFLYLRKPIDKQPILKINPEVKNFYDFTIDDFCLENFNCPYKNLKFDVAI